MKRHDLLFVVLLFVGTLLVWWPATHNGFVRYDDHVYVTENAQVAAGMSVAGMRWAFTHAHASNWHPLTWLSHMTDVQLFGLEPAGHHAVSVLLHALNAVLLALVFVAATGRRAPAYVLALLFAVHPVRVESVAWISERKDVLAGFFGLLTLLAYVRYARRPSAARMVLVGASLALGLMAKPTLVTLPFVLLLLDRWPLERWTEGRSSGKASDFACSSFRGLFVEKAPLFLLALGASAVAIWSQSEAGSVSSLERLPLDARLANGGLAYLGYLRRLFWPTGLACFYPHPAMIAQGAQALMLYGALAGAGLLSVSVGVFLALRRAPFLFVGWFWFFGMLVPVIGVVQVGNQALADRYLYLPGIGVSIFLVFGVARMFAGKGGARLLGAGAGVVVLLLSFMTVRQVRTWKDTRTLFERALSVTDKNYVAHVNLGTALARSGSLMDAEGHLRAALEIRGEHAEAANNLGSVLLQRNQPEEARGFLRTAVRVQPDYAEAHYNLGLAEQALGDGAAALGSFARAGEADADLLPAHRAHAQAALRAGDAAGAGRSLRRVLELRPDDLGAAANLALLLASSEDEAVRNGPEALRLAEGCAERTDYAQAEILAILAAAHAENGAYEEAVHWQERVVAAVPPAQREAMEARLTLYRAGQPLRQ